MAQLVLMMIRVGVVNPNYLMSRLYMLKAQVRICRFLSLLANIFFDASHYKINGMTDAIFKMFHPL